MIKNNSKNNCIYNLNLIVPIQHRKIAETLQNDFNIETMQYCILRNHCCKISTMLRCPLFVILQQNSSNIAMYLYKFFTKILKWKLFVYYTYISLTFNFSTNRKFLVICAFQKTIFYDKTIKYSNKYSINSEG